MDDTYNGEWLKSLSAEEKQAIRIYTGNDYTKINRYLRGTAETLDGVDPKVLESLNSALGKAKVPMRERGLEHKWELDSKMALELDIKDRLMPTIYGGVIGDMLGVPVEFRKRGSYKVEGVTGYGTYNQKPGTWSDDTSMTFCLIQNIIEKGTTEDLMQKFVDYAEKGYMTPYGKMFDIGRTTVESIRRFKKGIPAEECGGDTDTIASITGSLAGMLYEMESIPEEWINSIANKEMVDDLIYSLD